VEELGVELGVKTLIPKFEYCTDNAAMIGITAYYKYLKGAFSDLSLTPATGLGIS
jgi:N6-L-threonylcarbamoyladenine synthase